MADKPPTLPPASTPFPGSRTPGWNDPPTLQYNPVANTGQKRHNLNKRVAFPLQGTTGSESIAAMAKPTAIVQPHMTTCVGTSSPMCFPPSVGTTSPGITQPIAVVHPMPSVNTPPMVARVPAIPLPPDATEYSLRVLREQISFIDESLTVRREEIERRIGSLEQLWQSGNLSTAVQEHVYRLSKAIEDKHYNEAMELYTYLVTNYSSECSSWALALRQIVLTLNPNIMDATTVTTVSANISSSTSSSLGHVPTMFVPAMPRQVSSNETSVSESGINAGREPSGHLSSSVQHI